VGRLLQYQNRARRGPTKDDRLTQKSRDPISETTSCIEKRLTPLYSDKDFDLFVEQKH